jgi:hypothetical protein
LNPVSKNGNLIWLCRNNEKKNAKVKMISLYKLHNNRFRELKIKLTDKYNWQHVDWSRDNNIAVRGVTQKRKSGNNSFVLIRFNSKTNASQTTIFKHHAEIWYPVADFKHAFTTSRKTNSNGSTCTFVDYVDLESGKVIKLKGSHLPSWIVNNKFAFRTVRKNGRKLFLKLNLHNSREEKICEIPSKLLLSGVSFDGQFAFFTYNGLISFATFRVFNIPKKSWKKVETTGFSGFGSVNETLALVNPKFSMWSPTTHSAIIETLECNLEYNLIKAKTKIWQPPLQN